MSTPQTVGDEMGVKKKTTLLKTTQDMSGVVPVSLFKINTYTFPATLMLKLLHLQCI